MLPRGIGAEFMSWKMAKRLLTAFAFVGIPLHATVSCDFRGFDPHSFGFFDVIVDDHDHDEAFFDLFIDF